jgi:hypothetical protein
MRARFRNMRIMRGIKALCLSCRQALRAGFWSDRFRFLQIIADGRVAIAHRGSGKRFAMEDGRMGHGAGESSRMMVGRTRALSASRVAELELRRPLRIVALKK